MTQHQTRYSLLARAVQMNDERAWEELFRHYRFFMYHIFSEYRITGSDADDLVQEAWLTASLNHPNIIKLHAVGLDENERPFFTMDLKSNSTLETVVKAQAPLRELLTIFLKVCYAIAYAHSRRVYHLDL